MADVSDGRRKRAEARQRRRKQADDVEEEQAPQEAEDHSGVLQAAKVAAVAGAAGAAAAAARALASHDDGADQDEPEDEAQPEPQAERAEPDEPEQEPAEEQQEPEPQPEEDEPEEEQEPVAGAPASDARKALDQGRQQLEDLLGKPVEAVSSLERTHDGWVLALEVVELRRVPETTDVLGSYELELDDDLNLRRYQQARRYVRSQAGDGDGS
jgi:type IV secretory pathway VirB10-like protein